MDTIRWFSDRVDAIMEDHWRSGRGMFTPEVVRLLKLIDRLEAK